VEVKFKVDVCEFEERKTRRTSYGFSHKKIQGIFLLKNTTKIHDDAYLASNARS
jgi:hypothetical protein